MISANTVARAVSKSIANLGATFLTVHAYPQNHEKRQSRDVRDRI